MASYIDAVVAFFPFEVEFFARYGIAAYCAGYPVIERAEAIRGGDGFRQRFGIAADAMLLAVLPGSRRNEIRFIMPAFRGAVEILAREIPRLVCVIPTVDQVAAPVQQAARNWPTPVHVVEANADRFAALDAADVAIAASGTVTTELALARTPMVVGYRLGSLTYALARPFIHVPYIVLINLLLQREAVPELIQGACTPERLASALRPLLVDHTAREAQLRELDAAVRMLGLGGEPPSIRAAHTILAIAQKTDPLLDEGPKSTTAEAAKPQNPGPDPGDFGEGSGTRPRRVPA
jgi:lipid-A-disaccharide synthase